MTQHDFIADDLNDDPVSPERQKKIEEAINLLPQIEGKTIIVTGLFNKEDWDKLQEKMKVLREAYDKEESNDPS